MLKRFIVKYTLPIFLIIGIAASSSAQINASLPARTGVNIDYTLDNGIVYITPNWVITNGTVQSTTVSGTTYTATVQWTAAGAGSISFRSKTNVISTLNVTVCGTPTAYTLSGGGAYCSGGTGVSITLNGSQSGYSYQLIRNGTNQGASVSGTGAALTWSNQTLAGSYAIVATNPVGGCTQSMNNTVTVTANPSPSTYTVSGGGTYCTGSAGSGFAIQLSSSAIGVNYQLKLNGANVGTPLAGLASLPLSWPNQVTSGTYTVVATRTDNGCTTTMSGSAIIAADPVPSINVSGPTALVYGSNTTLTASTVSYSYQWKKDGAAIPFTTQAYIADRTGSITVSTKATATSQECVSTPVTLTNSFQTQAAANPTNYVSVTSIAVPNVTASTSLYSLSPKALAQAIAFQDGLGSTFQTVGVGQSGNQTDLISPASFGKNGLPDTVAFLPYASSTKNGWFKLNAIRNTSNQYVGSEQQQFYQTAPKVAQDAYPFARVVYKQSPDARVLEQGAPGADWQPGQHMVISAMALNNATYPVRYWKVDGSTNSYYTDGTVAVAITTDENGNEVRTFTNSLGQTVLKQVQEGATSWLQTYYIYDRFGRLTYQLPPEAVNLIANNTTYNVVNNATISELIYKYSYDSLGRVKEKKVPGSGAEYIVYDKLGRPVLTQDANLRATGKWNFVKYDQYGRVAYSGWYASALSRRALQDSLNNKNYTTQPYYEIHTTVAQGGTMQGYTNTVFPTTGLTILAASYYDTYDFDQNGTNDFTYQPTHLTTGLPASPSSGYMLRGMPTGSTRLVLGTSTWLRSVVFYDDLDRVVQSQSYNHLNTTTPDVSSVAYADLVHVDKTKQTHNGPTVVTIEQRYVYDNNWRTKEIWHKTNGGTEYMVAAYFYNALGQVVDKQLHTVSGVPLQSIDYRYHIRGWLKSINNALLTNDGTTNDDANDYFGMELTYNTVDSIGNTAYYNGNLAAVKWKGPGKSGWSDRRSFKYTYDKSERLLTTTFAAHTGAAWTIEQYTLDESFSYDFNGNIKTLARKYNQRSAGGANSAQLVDNLTYTYETNTNRLKKVEDSILPALGIGNDFKNVDTGTEYTYNTDGSLTKDDNKGISTIAYNEMGKPTSITYTNGNTVAYTYDAAGSKLKMVSTVSSVATTTDYVGGFIYTNNALAYFASPEGRIVKNGSNYEYQYAIADHQGNTRVLMTSVDQTPAVLTATFEGNSGDNSGQFGGISTIVTNGSANHTAGGSKVVRMNQTVPVAVTKSMRVYAGDEIDIETYCYYEGTSGFGSSNVSMAAIINTVAAAFGGVNGGAGESGSIYSGVNAGITNGGLGPNQGDGQPSAYLNYILFDQQYKVQTMGFISVPSSANMVKQLIKIDDIAIKESGYLFVYLSYETESNNWVFFDDLKIAHTKTKVIQYNEYYAHGSPTANSWTRENNTGNSFLANSGTELNKVTALYDLDYRHFDPILGRMNGVDPMADKYSSLTPYNYSFNSPTMHTDASGADPDFEPNYWVEESMQRRAARSRGGAIDMDFSSRNQFSGLIRSFGVSLGEQRAMGGFSNSYNGYYQMPLGEALQTIHDATELTDAQFAAKWGQQISVSQFYMLVNICLSGQPLDLNNSWRYVNQQYNNIVDYINTRSQMVNQIQNFNQQQKKLERNKNLQPFVIKFSERMIDDGWGVYIQVGYNDKDKQYKSLRWVQTVKTNSQSNEKCLGSEFVDPCPGTEGYDGKPFYYTDEEEIGRIGKNGFTTSFFDGPWRFSNDSGATWMAQLSLVGSNGGAYTTIATITYGFQIYNNTLTIITPKYVMPTAFHLNSFSNQVYYP